MKDNEKKANDNIRKNDDTVLKLDIEMTTANPMNKGGKVRWEAI